MNSTLSRAMRCVTVAVASVTVIAASATSAWATTDYTPTGGPAVKLQGTNIAITNVPAAQTITCSQFTVPGTVTSPGMSRPLGTTAVGLGTPSETCSHPLMGSISFDVSWNLAVLDASATSSWRVRLVDVSGTAAWANCEWTFEGQADGLFDTATQQWTPTTSALVITGVVGSMCVTIDFLPGDEIVISGSLTNVPPAGSVPLSFS
ncbi:hypothetical protein [Aeromicrobium sp.]|uniref:hypothetical protein n=1 Tax=Aeromicrobium sp. TaxID=1871063 RepID=UPI002FCA8B81